jgi:DNA repair photolyase
MKIDYIDAKQILVRNSSPENWFGVHYNMNVYRGCQHECIYCDSRSECYQIDSFNDLEVKRNAADLLEDTLMRRRKKVTIGTGSMSDPYIPAEKHIRLTEKVLRVIIKYKYPFHIITKSDLILRDLNLLKEINKVFLSVCFTITTCDELTAMKIEPKAPSPHRRLKALQILTENNIYTGVLFQPILPFLLDNEENIKETVYNVAQAGGKFIIPLFAVTMRKGQREYFLDKLDIEYPGLKEKYLKNFHYQYTCNSPKTHLYKFFEQQCKKNKLHYKMKDIMNYSKLNPYKQMSLFDLLGDYHE